MSRHDANFQWMEPNNLEKKKKVSETFSRLSTRRTQITVSAQFTYGTEEIYHFASSGQVVVVCFYI